MREFRNIATRKCISISTLFLFFLSYMYASATAVSYTYDSDRIAGTSPVYSVTLQAAYNSAVDGDLMEVQAVGISGNLFLQSISVQPGEQES
jgi:hypothetical protein